MLSIGGNYSLESYHLPADSLPTTMVNGVVRKFGLVRADFAEERKDLRDARGRGMMSTYLGRYQQALFGDNEVRGSARTCFHVPEARELVALPHGPIQRFSCTKRVYLSATKVEADALYGL